MATKIIHKKSSVAEKVPLTTDLEIGELAINLVDKKLFSKDGNGNIIEFGSVEVQQLTVYNGTGATIPKGSVVYINGAQGQKPSVALASNASEATSSKTFGFVIADIANGAEGIVTTEGLVYNLNTAGLTEGGAVYLGATAGSVTQTKPVAPAHLVSLGWVVKANSTSGRILAHVQNGFELDELHDVLITSPANDQVLTYETATGLWKNKAPTGGGGGVTSVTGTAPIVSSGGTTPAISISAATTSAAGSMSSTDKTKLDGIAAGAQVNVATNISQGTRTTTTVPITSSTGTGATLDIATTSLAGVMSSADKTKLDGIATNANNYVLPAATSTTFGGVELFSDTVQSVAANTVSSTASRTYGVQANGSGQLVVNVPWSSSSYTLPAATSTTLGGVELFSDTVQTVAAEAVSATASRTYGVQVNAAGQAVVNVPWSSSGGGVTSFSAGGTGLTPSTGTTGAVTLGGTLIAAAGGTGVTNGRIAVSTLNGLVSTTDVATTLTATSATSYHFTGTASGQTVTIPTTGIPNGHTYTFSTSNPEGLFIEDTSGFVAQVFNSMVVNCVFIGGGWQVRWVGSLNYSGNGNIVFDNNSFISNLGLLGGYTEEVSALSGTTPELTPTNGSIQTWTLSGNSTPTAGTWESGQSLLLMIDDGTARTITWTSLPVVWETNGGAAPTLSTTGITGVALWKVGTTIYGARVGDV